MGLLPWGLSRILGITVYLDIPADTAWVGAAAGVVLVAAGVLLALPWRPPSRQRAVLNSLPCTVSA